MRCPLCAGRTAPSPAANHMTVVSTFCKTCAQVIPGPTFPSGCDLTDCPWKFDRGYSLYVDPDVRTSALEARIKKLEGKYGNALNKLREYKRGYRQPYGMTLVQSVKRDRRNLVRRLHRIESYVIRYGSHLPGCAGCAPGMDDCSCGFHAVRKAIKS